MNVNQFPAITPKKKVARNFIDIDGDLEVLQYVLLILSEHELIRFTVVAMVNSVHINRR